MSPLDVLSMGRTLVDLYPAEDGPVEAVTGFTKAVGGSPSNVALAVARLGHRAGMISRVGDDAFGRFARQELQDAGVDVTQVIPIPGGSTPVAICEISPPDHFPLTIYRPEPPVDVAIDSAQLDLVAISRATIFWTSLSGLSAEPARAAHRRAFGVRRSSPATDQHTVIDLDFRAAFWPHQDAAAEAARAVLDQATVLIGNLEECRIVTGATTPAAAADALLAAGARLAIVKLGEDGVLAATAESREFAPPISVTVANGLGAGDAFGGALCHGLLEGWPLDRVLAAANAAGALVASRRGCSTAMPSRAELEEALAGSTSRRA